MSCKGAGDALPVILWQDWETLGEAREGSEDTEWRAYSPHFALTEFSEEIGR